MFQYLALAKASTSDKTLPTVIEQALNHQNIFNYGELLSLDNIKKLSGGDASKHFNTLQLFAYGTFKDYQT